MKNVFGQTICETTCPAWSEEHEICDARMDYVGRIGTVDGKPSCGLLCPIPDHYRLVRRTDCTISHDIDEIWVAEDAIEASETEIGQEERGVI